MKVKIGDLVIPSHQVGKIISITPREVAIEVKARDGTLRVSKLTEEQAHLRGITLEQLVNEALTIVGTTVDSTVIAKQNHYRE